jgi:uncharacterized membrane protein
VSTLLLFVVVSICLLFCAVPLLEAVWGVMFFGLVLGTGLSAFMGGDLAPFKFIFTGTLIASVSGMYLYFGRRRKWLSSDLDGFLVFLLAYALLYILVMRWPDFYPLGERLRDYALFFSLQQNPISPQEPWMAGFPLYYYAWWYRFGAMISKVLSLPTWQLYHDMVVVAMAFFISVVWSISQRVFRGSWIAATYTTLLVALGSNVSGIHTFFTSDSNWWGPSRVIQGAINEFPAWSFLLGDAHPHYLNLGFVPFIVLVFIRLYESPRAKAEKTLVTILLFIAACVWLKGANAWEVPMWVGTFFVAVLLGAWAYASERKYISFDLWNALRLRTIGLLVVFTTCVLILFIFQEEVKAGDVELDFVRSPILLTRTVEGFLHWGLPLTLAVLFLPLRTTVFSNRILLYISFLALAAFDLVYPIFFLLLFFQVWYLLQRQGSGMSVAEVVVESYGVAALGLLLLPELVFLNDAYGGENERMNTIFKVYTYAWFPFHLWSFNLVYEAINSPRFATFRKFPLLFRLLPLFISAECFLGCFFWIAFGSNMRSSTAVAQWNVEGLSRVEQTYAGAANAIKALRAAPRGTVLEAQAGAYSWCSHMATLAGQPSYLGWKNHTELLTKATEEATRRESKTKEIYQALSCAEALRISQEEGIRYIVVGPLEEETYQISRNSFGCFKKIKEAGRYLVAQTVPDSSIMK